MHYRISLASLCLLFSALGTTPVVQAQALIPHTVVPDAQQLRQTGLSLLREAVQLAQFQQYELALARTELATQLVPESAEAWALLGGLYLSVTKIDPGIRALEKSLTINPKNAGVNFSLGSAYFRKEDYASAVRVLKTGLSLKPDVPEALFDLGNAYYRLGEYDKAIAQYRKAVDNDQKFWPAINNIGLVRYEQGSVDKAMEYWEAAIKIDDKTSEPKLALAVALYKKGQQNQGINLAAAALTSDRRYGDIEFLKENLWGDRLIADTMVLLETPVVRDSLAQAPLPPEEEQGVNEGSEPEPVTP